MKKKIFLDFMIPLFVLIGFTMFFRFTDADIVMSDYFYSSEGGWIYKDKNPWDFLYHYGNIPGLALGIIALFTIVATFFSHKVVPYRKMALFLVVFLLLGPGLIISQVFKVHWGRPRPSQTENFGGQEKFLPVWVKGVSEYNRSFPSGHASIGYFLFSPFFFLRRISKKGAVLSLSAGMIYGTLMGIGRIVQGGHFASDVLWAGGFIYLTGLLLFYLFRFDKEIWWKPKNQNMESCV